MAVAAAGVTLVAAGAGVVALGLRDRAPAGDPFAQAAQSAPDREVGAPSEHAFANLDDADAGQVEVAHEIAPSVVRVDTGAARGSGVIVRSDGLVLTSLAVVGEQREVAVALGNGQLLNGTVVGTDPLTGVALVDLPGGGYAATDLTGVPSSAILGEPGLAFGVDELGRLVLGAGDIGPMPLQAIRPGQSALDGVLVVETVVDPVVQGGPLVDEVGTLVGLTTWTDGGQTYAVPATALRKVVDDFLRVGSVRHTWLGISGTSATDNGWPAGVRITDVAPDGPSAGVLRAEDVVVAIDQQLVSQMSALVAELRHHDPGDVVHVSYRRNGHGSALTQPVVLGLRPQSISL